MRDLGSEDYAYATSPAALPADVRSALAKEFQEARLAMAAKGETFSAGCVVQPGVPRRRLVLAAVSARYAVVHFEQGGFALFHRVLVFRRDPDTAALLWSGTTRLDLQTPAALQAALRSGELWKAESAAPQPGSCA